MRIFSRALLLITLMSPAVGLAQFQAPTSEELKMSSDPQAPGAAAVYLNIDDETDGLMHKRILYVRIKVLAEKGKELATVEIPYFKGSSEIADIKGRTIHPDGTIVPMEVKPEELMVARSGGLQIEKMVFTLPAVDVGSILEYSYVERGGMLSSPYWEVQREYFVHNAHYAFVPGLRGAIYWPVLPQGAAVHSGHMGKFTLDITDVPPAPQEEWMPPGQSFLYRVVFVSTSSESSEGFWISAGKAWSDSVDSFAEPSKAMRRAVAELVAPTDSAQEKARKLYLAVQELNNTDFTRSHDKAELKELKLKDVKSAGDVWEQKAGTSTEIALLYLGMLRAAGLTAYAMKVVDRDKGVFEPAFMSMAQMHSTIVILSVDGKELALDPGEKMCPFGTVHWHHAGAGGIRQSAAGPAVASSPNVPYTENSVLRFADLTLDGQGGVSGSGRFAMSGQEALYWRQKAFQSDPEEVKKAFEHWLGGLVPEGVEAHVDRFRSLDKPEEGLIAYFSLKGTLGTATGKRMILPGFFYETRTRQPFVDQEKRMEPVDMQYASSSGDQVVYHLPEGMQVEASPQDAKLVWENRALLTATVTTAPGQVTVARKMQRGFALVKPESYPGLRDFYLKIDSSNSQQIVLTRQAIAKGN